MAKVLVVEDEPALLESYCEIVSGLGHECVGAIDGNQAVELATESPPDVVVSDYMMPAKNGIELARAFKSIEALARVPIIVLSAGRPSEHDRREAWRFLPKPVAIEVLERTVEEAIASTRDRRLSTMPPPSASVGLAREEMLNWVSHEIKTPLSAAMTATQLALRGVAQGIDVAGLSKRLVVISRQLTRMNELVNSLLDAAALQDGKLEVAREATDLPSLAQDCVTYWSELHPDVTFELHAGDGSAHVLGDRERLRQVLDNLVSNAIKYGRPANHVRVEIEALDGHVAVAVSDRGKGIPPEEVGRIFDRFHRVAGQGGRGHGLGLYIAAALTRLHGGTIVVDSAPGGGSTFRITLPRHAFARSENSSLTH